MRSTRLCLLVALVSITSLACTRRQGPLLPRASADSNPPAVEEPFARLPWTIAVPEGMELVNSSADGVFFGAKPGPDGAREASVKARHSVGTVPPPGETPEARAERVARDYEGTLGTPPRKSSPARVDGQAAWETFANVRAPDGGSKFVYHLVVAAEGYDVSISGDTSANREGTWLPRFRASAGSWKAKPK